MKAQCQNPSGTPCGEPGKKLFVATRTVSLACPEGSTGDAVVITRQACSPYSQDHADKLAYELALTEARREIVCTWTAEVCVQPVCGTYTYEMTCETRQSTISAQDAHAKAKAAADSAAASVCLG